MPDQAASRRRALPSRLTGGPHHHFVRIGRLTKTGVLKKGQLMVMSFAEIADNTTSDYKWRPRLRLTGARAFDQCPAPFAGGHPLPTCRSLNRPQISPFTPES